MKQYGEMRTGTNVIALLINRNIPNINIITHGPGSKHEAPDYNALSSWPVPLQFLISVRDPYSWLYGILRKSKLKPGFGTQLIGPHFDTGTLFYDEELHRSLIGRWNYHYYSWLELREKRPEMCHVVRLEDMFASQEHALCALLKELWIDCIPEFKPVTGEAVPWPNTKEIGTFTRQQFYLQRCYLKELRKETVDLVGETVDWDTMEKFGYERYVQ